MSHITPNSPSKRATESFCSRAMIFRETRRLLGVLPFFRSIKRQDQCLCRLEKKIPTREFGSAFPNKYHDAKHGELKERLAKVASLNMLEKEEDRFRHALCNEMDERLVDVQKWFLKVFDHNAGISRKVSSAVLLQAFCAYGFSMDDPTWDHWDSEKWRAVVILAWCVELLQVYHIMIDDIIDRSVLRSGNPCWYTKPGVGLHAIIDALFLQSGLQKLLQTHFAGSRFYTNILHEFVQANHATLYGQVIDTMYNPKNQIMDMFTFEKYQTLIEYKTKIVTFFLPLHLAMHLTLESSMEEFEFIRDLSLKLAIYFQVQDDYLDCYEDLEVTGETSNDIPEGRLTFWSVKFLQVASKSMKKEFFENYGVDDKDAIAKVLELYRKTNLLERFEEFEAQLSAEIRLIIQSRSDIKAVLFNDLFDQIQERNFV